MSKEKETKTSSGTPKSTTTLVGDGIDDDQLRAFSTLWNIPMVVSGKKTFPFTQFRSKYIESMSENAKITLSETLGERETQAVQEYYDENAISLKAILGDVKEENFKGFARSALDNDLQFIVTAIALSGRIQKNDPPFQTIRHVNAILLALNKILTNQVKAMYRGDWRGVRLLTLTSSMFPWFVRALESWGLVVTPEGLTTVVEIEPGHRRKNTQTAANIQRWKEFTSEPTSVFTFAHLSLLCEWARVLDVSKTGTDQWGGWKMGIDTYLFFINSPRLKKQPEYANVRQLLDKARQDLFENKDLLGMVSKARTEIAKVTERAASV